MAQLGHSISVGSTIYRPSPAHRRRGNPNKSTWTIVVNDEVRCFLTALRSGWCLDVVGWGLHFDGQDRPAHLGLSTQGEAVKIAKFAKGANEWHGYPIDYRRNIYDRPVFAVVSLWHRSGIIDKADMRRVLGGQPCSLSS